MQKEIYKADNIVEAIYDSDLKSIIVTWYSFDSFEHLRLCLEAQLDCAKNNDVKVFVVDTRKAKGMLDQSDQDWFATNMFPALEKYKTKAVITVLPQSALTLLSAKQWQMTGNSFGMDFIDTASLDAAMELIQNYI